jgi:hypothetical protein
LLVIFLEVDVLETSREVDSTALAHIHWLDDESLGLFPIELGFELSCLTRKYPRLGEEVILAFEGSGEPH